MNIELDPREATEDQVRELIIQVLLFHQVVGEHFRLSETESRCLDLLYYQSAMTAGRMAAETGLTSGAITKIVDRLEKAGFVHREHSQADRRQVIIHLNTERAQEMREVYTSLVHALAKVTEGYSPAKREMIGDYQQDLIAVLREETARLKQ